MIYSQKVYSMNLQLIKCAVLINPKLNAVLVSSYLLSNRSIVSPAFQIFRAALTYQMSAGTLSTRRRWSLASFQT